MVGVANLDDAGAGDLEDGSNLDALDARRQTTTDVANKTNNTPTNINIAGDVAGESPLGAELTVPKNSTPLTIRSRNSTRPATGIQVIFDTDSG
jgi:hypothetical protein